MLIIHWFSISGKWILEASEHSVGTEWLILQIHSEVHFTSGDSVGTELLLHEWIRGDTEGSLKRMSIL